MKVKPRGLGWSYSSTEVGLRAESLTQSILQDLEKSGIQAEGRLDPDRQFVITFNFGEDESYNVLKIQDLLERGSPTGKFKFLFYRVYVKGGYNATCRVHEQNEIAKTHSLTKVVNTLRDRYYAIQAARIGVSQQGDLLRQCLEQVEKLHKAFPDLKNHVRVGSAPTHVELRFLVDPETAAEILKLFGGKFTTPG